MEAATVALLVVIVAAVAVMAGSVRFRIAKNERMDEIAPRPPSVTTPSETLRRALLPATPPVVDGVRISWSYVPATSEGSGGGDFYDAFFLDDGNVAIAIGDASGGGLAAFVAMNTVRQAIRNAMIEGAGPADALRHANRVLLRSDHPGIVSALAGIVDPGTLQFRYAAAGHPAPLLAGSGDTCIQLPNEGSGIALGLVPHHVSSEHVVGIPLDGMLALYSDGCVSAGHDGAIGTQLLTEAVGHTRELAPNEPAPTIDRAIFGQGDRADDVTIMTITPEAQLARLDVRLPAELTSAPLARTALRRFLATTPLDERRAFDAVVATGEAVANAIEHAYDRRPNQSFVLRANYEPEACTIIVEDAGIWNDVEPLATRGRGIAMMRELCDAVDIERTGAGSSVALTFTFGPSVVADASLIAV